MTHHTTVVAPRRHSLLSRFHRTPRATATVRTARTSRFGRKKRTTATPRLAGTHLTHGTMAHGAIGHGQTEEVVVAPARRSRFGFRHRPVVVEKRRTTLSDKISGAMMKLRGSLSGRPREKLAGERRMHGTADGRKVRHY